MIRSIALPVTVGLSLFLAIGTAQMPIVSAQDSAEPVDPGSQVVVEDTPTSYWPEGVQWNRDITTPEQFFGFEIGHRHLSHAQVADYMRHLAEQSDRITIQEYARTHGGRPLLLLTITSGTNRGRLAKIQASHRALAKPDQSSEVDAAELPAVINMGYGVHGDEPSATNSSPLVAHYLAAAQGPEIEQVLERCIILLDPSLNPDGFNRFANWVNAYRGLVLNPDAQHAEHNQNWPPGRVNYYWFDLNRDWLPAEHPESRGRLNNFHQWKPNVVLDFHEMGTNSTFFFQPGIPQRTNPLTPAKNIELTNRFATYHASDLDKRGSLYYTQEVFDDFYMGKGSTYPDLHGAVGILFEQASSRGHLQRNQNGLLRFHDTIANQFAASLSSLRATTELSTELNEFKREFYRESLQMAAKHRVKSFVFSCPNNRTRIENFADLLLRHDIECYWSDSPIVADGRSFDPRWSLVVPADQPEYRFLRSLLMRRKSFKENVFYDVSTWTISLAYDLDQFGSREAIDVSNMRSAQLGGRLQTQFAPDSDVVSYLIDWRDDDSVWLLQQLLQQEINVKVAKKPFSSQINDEIVQFPIGTLQVPLGIQDDKRQMIEELLAKGAERGVAISVAKTGLTPSGIDFGSGNFSTIQNPKLAMPIAGGVSAYGAGEIWHALDTRVGLPVSMLKMDRFNSARMDEYNTLLLPSGRYSAITSERWEQIRAWVQRGGTVIAVGGSCVSAFNRIRGQAQGDETPPDARQDKEADDPPQLPFDTARKTRALQLISGAIFRTNVDTTHPLLYGYSRNQLPVFRNHTTFLPPSDNPYCNPMLYDNEKPLMAGYCSGENIEQMKGTAATVVHPLGQGRVILIADNPNFRGFWHGPARVFLNAIYFGPFVNP